MSKYIYEDEQAFRKSMYKLLLTNCAQTQVLMGLLSGLVAKSSGKELHEILNVIQFQQGQIQKHLSDQLVLIASGKRDSMDDYDISELTDLI